MSVTAVLPNTGERCLTPRAATFMIVRMMGTLVAPLPCDRVVARLRLR